MAGAGASLTAWERGAHALAVMFIMSALAFWPVVMRVDPRLAVACSPGAWVEVRSSVQLAWDDEAVDPWGNEWRWLREEHWVSGGVARPWRPLVSLGPDGTPSSDDVPAYRARAHPLARAVPVVVLARPSSCLAALGLALAAWTAASRRFIRAPRATLAHEVARAAVMVALPWLAIAPWLAREAPALDDVSGLLVVPPRVALASTWTALLLLPALAWRLSRAREAA